MNFMDIIAGISPALEQGKSLANAEAWSNVATTTHALVVIFGFFLLIAKSFNYDLGITDDQLFKIAGVVATVGGSASSYFHHACHKDAGIKLNK